VRTWKFVIATSATKLIFTNFKAGSHEFSFYGPHIIFPICLSL